MFSFKRLLERTFFNLERLHRSRSKILSQTRRNHLICIRKNTSYENVQSFIRRNKMYVSTKSRIQIKRSIKIFQNISQHNLENVGTSKI